MVNGKKLKHLRNQRGMTQAEFAEAIKVNRSQVAKYEMGTSSMKLETLLLICSLFKTTPNCLLGFEEVTDKQPPADNALERNLLSLLSEEVKHKNEEIAALKARLIVLEKNIH